MRKIIFTFIALATFSICHSTAQVVTTVAGSPEIEGETDGDALEDALFNNPHGIAIDSQGVVYIADRWNHKIRRLTPDGLVNTIAGTGQIGTDDGIGPNATFHEPWGLCADPIGNLYIADTRNNLIRKVDTAGNVTTYAGTGTYGVRNGSASDARFANPTGITINSAGIIYVADHLGHTIRSITPDGNVSTIAGVPFTTGSTDGTGAQATFHRPYGIELDHDGNIIVADEWNHLIRKVTPDGEVTTVAGTGQLGSIDGPASASKFNYPWDVVSDPGGNIYVMDGDNHVIRLISPGGFVSTYVGEAGRMGATDGIGVEASFNGATALCMNHYSGEIYIGDAYNNLIRKLSPLGIIGLRAQNYGNRDSICVGTEVDFMAEPAIYVRYDFFVDGQLQQTGSSPEFSHLFDESGPKTMTVEAYLGNGGKISSGDFILFVFEQPEASFVVVDSSRLTNPDGLEVSFDATTETISSWYWDFGDPSSGSNNISFEKSPTHTYLTEGVFTVQLIVEGGSCSDKLTQDNFILYSIQNDTTDSGNGGNQTPPDNGNSPDDQGEIFIPSAFTPNGDGLNDILYVRGKDIINLNFRVFDEWGNILFQTTSIENGWNGQFMGKPVTTDTYAYLAEIFLTDGRSFNLTGHITVLR
ncbi:MAG: T9SS type B sorting domain-containing protein [Bacteroidota bacterium]